MIGDTNRRKPIRLLQSLFIIAAAALSFSAKADVSVDWTSPADGSEYAAGTGVTLTGVAGASGVVGAGLDLVLVLDSSGSMGSSITSGGETKSLAAWQKEAAIALVNNLPSGTSVGVVEFDSDANLVTGLVSLSSNLGAVVSAINATDASGGTNIGFGINVAAAELLGDSATAGFSQQMIVFSDGYSSGNPPVNAAAAIAAGVEAVHSVALPGSNATVMEQIATAGDGTFIDVTDGDLVGLTSLFSGAGGTLVDLDYVEVTMPDGTTSLVPTDVFGNFSLEATIELGSNTFIAEAYGTDGTYAFDVLTLTGIDGTTPGGVTPVPVPATLPLTVLGLFGIAMVRRRANKKKS